MALHNTGSFYILTLTTYRRGKTKNNSLLSLPSLKVIIVKRYIYIYSWHSCPRVKRWKRLPQCYEKPPKELQFELNDSEILSKYFIYHLSHAEIFTRSLYQNHLESQRVESKHSD